jgi:hypothetical protein
LDYQPLHQLVTQQLSSYALALSAQSWKNPAKELLAPPEPCPEWTL